MEDHVLMPKKMKHNEALEMDVRRGRLGDDCLKASLHLIVSHIRPLYRHPRMIPFANDESVITKKQYHQ